MTAGSPLARAKRRPISTISPAPREGTRSPNFDRDAAREAWRQFARNRGARLQLEPPRRGPWIAVVTMLCAVGGAAVWFGWDDARHSAVATPAPAEASASEAAMVRPAQPSEPVVPIARPQPRSSSGFTAEAVRIDHPLSSRPRSAPIQAAEEAAPARPRDVRRRPVVAAEAVEEVPPQVETEAVEPPPPRRLSRVEGLSPSDARALRKVPRGSRDRPPVGGVSSSGLHVDRIGMGSAYEQGICDGPEATFSVRSHGQAHVCFRVVHLRQREQVMVLWEREGELVRRTPINIPAMHAYRTRAGLGLRRAFLGHWTVRVVDEQGTELAAYQFEVTN